MAASTLVSMVPARKALTSQHEGSASLRRRVLVGACLLAAITSCSAGGTDNSSASSVPRVSPRKADGVFTPRFPSSSFEEAGEHICSDLSLPFEILATRSSDEPCELLPSGQTETTVFTEKWSLGGDYRQIASIPIDTNQVFGSTTQEPADLYSYRPAFISRESAREFSSDLLRQDGSYVEPLDGTQNGSWITFLGRQISSASTENHQEDNAFFPWTVYAWDIDNQRLNTVMSWTDLPAHNPRSSGELPG